MGTNELLPYTGKATGKEVRIYQIKISSLLYAAIITRPDILFIISWLSRFNTNPSPDY